MPLGTINQCESTTLVNWITAVPGQSRSAQHAEVLAGGAERILLVEHSPVITFGRRDGNERNLIASEDELSKLGVELVKSDRGGDITFHGPGQIVAYPIIRLNSHRLSVGGYVHRLEDAVIALLTELGIAARKDPAAVGVWVESADGQQRSAPSASASAGACHCMAWH